MFVQKSHRKTFLDNLSLALTYETEITRIVNFVMEGSHDILTVEIDKSEPVGLFICCFGMTSALYYYKTQPHSCRVMMSNVSNE